MRTAFVLAAAFGALALFFRALEGHWPGRGRSGDAALWALNAACILLFADAASAARAYWPLDAWFALGPARDALVASPVWAQSVALLVVGEFTSYWTHRLVEHGPLWRFHAIHHASPRFDWLVTNVNHPVSMLVHFVGETVVPSLLLGIEPTVWVVAARVCVGVLSHADLDWDYGPFGRVLVSPALHRLHHTPQAGGHQTNFGVFLCVFDRLFGTYREPGRSPQVYGLPDDGVPASLWGRLSWPLRRQRGAA
ncbi:MAG: sterol desaturase family protein [Elusimicrobiota bacterium]|nr:sterol desaturase family protein [Elusimicrobiota bacterium]